MKKGKVKQFLTPMDSTDPLSPSLGYGWGWILLFLMVGYGLSRLSPNYFTEEVGTGLSIIIEIIVPTIGVFIYFLFRKVLIERKTVYKSYWHESLFAGLITYIISGAIFGLIFFAIVTIKRNL